MNYREFSLNFRYAFRPHKPLLVARLAWAVIKSQLLRRSFLRYVDFAIGFECNLKCEHCFATALKQEGRKVMVPADYGKVAGECMKLGTVNFSFQGGEPLLFKNLPEIIKACKPDRNIISVTTNGTMLTENRIKELKRMGVDILTISLDSSIPEEHDGFRGMPGSFEKTLAGIKLALKHGLNVTLGTVVTHKSLRGPGITGLFRLAEDLRIILNIIMPVSAGRWSEKSDIALTEEDIAYIDDIVATSGHVRTDFQGNLYKCGCGAGKEILYLTPYGDVLVCPFIHIHFGNIFSEPVASIRARALSLPCFAKYADKCLASTDKQFTDKYMSKLSGAAQLPAYCDTVFGGPRDGEAG